MQIEKTDVSAVEIQLTVTVPPEDMAERVEEAQRRITRNVQMPGFRKGRAPKKVIWQRYGDSITADAVENALQDYYRAALQKMDINPLAPGKMEEVSFKPGEPLVFKVKLEKAPEINIPDFSDVSVELEQPQVSEEDVLEAIDHIREQQAILTPTDEPVSEDSVLIVDIQELDPSGLPIVGRTQRDAHIDMRHNPLGKDFAEKVMRAREGEQVRFTIDGSSGSPEEKKPPVHLEVTLKSVRRKELPPFDDDFAASLNPKITSTDALKEALNKQLTDRAASSARRKMHNHLIDALLREENFPVPPQMLDDYLERLIKDSRGDNGEQDAEKDEALKEELHAVGVRNVRWFLLRQELIRVHELKAGEEDLEREFEILSKMSEKSLDEIKATYADEDKRSDLLEAVTDRNIFAFLEKQVTVVPVPVDLATFEGRATGRIIAP